MKRSLIVGTALCGVLLVLSGAAASVQHAGTAANPSPSAGVAITTHHAQAPFNHLGPAVKAAPQYMARERKALVHAVSGTPTANKYASAVSGNWSGLLTSGSFQGIAGEWTVPSVQATAANHYSCTWVGLDGWSAQSLVQTGTEEDSVNGHAHYYAWLETLPAAQTPIVFSNGSLVPVVPGDTMWAYIYMTSATQWTIYLQDITRGWSLSTARTYSTPGTTVEWIHEATQENGVIGTPPVFSRVNFSHLEVKEAGTWYATTMNSRSEVLMEQNGRIYATPSAPSTTLPQSFGITYG